MMAVLWTFRCYRSPDGTALQVEFIASGVELTSPQG